MNIIEEVKKLNLEIGLNYNFNNLISELMELSFERVDYVSQVGEFAVRGGIIDIFPITFDHPIRIELWGEEIESIREFDVTSQRSIKSLNQASISSYTKINDNPKVNFYNLISNNFRLIIDDIELRPIISSINGTMHPIEYNIIYKIEDAIPAYGRISACIVGPEVTHERTILTTQCTAKSMVPGIERFGEDGILYGNIYCR